MENVVSNSKVVSRGLLLRAPLLPVALGLIAGIIAGKYLPAPVSFWFSISLGSLVAAAYTAFRKHLQLLTSLLILISIAGLGAGWFVSKHSKIEANHISCFADPASPAPVTIIGRVTSFPQMVQPVVPYGYKREPQLKFYVEAQKIKSTKGDWLHSTGLIHVTVNEPFLKLNIGDEVELVGTIGCYKQASNPGQFDKLKQAKMTGTWVWLVVPCSQAVTRLSTSDNLASEQNSFFTNAHWRAKSYLHEHLTQSDSPQNGRLLGALVLGDRHRSLQSLNRTMQQAGIAHFLSISGLHLGIFLGFTFLVLRLFGLAPRRCCMLVLGLLILYICIAQQRAPLLRSALMSGTILLGVILGRRLSSLNAISIALLILLLIDPRQLFQAGFQLSFGIVAGIIIFYRRFRELLFARLIQKRGLLVFRSKDRFRRWAYFGAMNWFMSFVTVSLIAYIIAAPLVAFHFGIFSPYAAVLSMLLLPFIIATLVPSYIALGFASVAPNLAEIFTNWANRAAGLLGEIVANLNALPGLSITVRPVAWYWVTLFYLLVAVIVFAPKCKRKFFASALLASVWIALTVFCQLPADSKNCARLDLLAVGSGQCVVLQSPDGNTWIFDAGTRSGFDLGHCICEPFLREQKLPAPEAVFVSHANTDHYNAVPALVESGLADKVFVSKSFLQNSADYSMQSRFIQALQKEDCAVSELCRGDKIQLDRHTTVEVLWPPVEFVARESNNLSLVLKVTCAGSTILLPGDIEAAAQAELLKNAELLKADVLIWPHHGAFEKTTAKFISAVAPKVLLVSNSKEPLQTAGARSKGREFFEKIKSQTRYFCTATAGWVNLSISRARIDVKTMRR